MDTLPLDDFAPPPPRLVQTAGVVAPVARVWISTPLIQLSQAWDFLVTAQLDARVQVGSLVKVRVGEQQHIGVVASRQDTTAWQKPLRPLEAVLGPFPLFTSYDLQLWQDVALHYGVFPAQLLRFALPTRRVKVENNFSPQPVALADSAPPFPAAPDTSWARYRDGSAWFQELVDGRHPRAVVTTLPGEELDAPVSRLTELAQLVAATWSRGEQSLLIFPTAEQATSFYLSLQQYFGKNHEEIVLYTSAIQETHQYKSFLQSRFGQAAVVIGTRGAVFIPMLRPGLFYCWDDTSYALSSDMAPNFTARQVLLYRAKNSGASLVLAHYAVSAADLQLTERGFATALLPVREILRKSTGRITVMEQEDLLAEGATGGMLLSNKALRVARQALSAGPVLVSVPPDGQFSVVSCSNCGTSATCLRCRGPLEYHGSRLECARCGLLATNYACQSCGGLRLRGRHLVSRTVIDDIGLSFRHTPIVVSHPGAGALDRVDDQPRIVVAQPGAEPVPVGGYQAVLILRPYMLTNRVELWTNQEVMRRFLGVAALAAPGKPVFVAGTMDPHLAQCLTRWDPWQAARRDLQERQDGGFAPAWRTVLLEAPHLGAILDNLQSEIPQGTVFGPVPSARRPGLQAAFVSVSLRQGKELSLFLRTLQLQLAAEKKGTAATLYCQVDPDDPAGQVG